MFTLTSFTHNNEVYHLRLFTHHYAEALATMVRQDFLHLSQFLSWPKADVRTEDEINFITINLKKFALGESCVCVICDDANHPLGVVDIHDHSAKHYRGEIGYWIAFAYQGKRIMTQLVIHFMHALHKEWLCRKFVLLAQHDNPGSNRVAQKAGFTFVATLRQHIMQKGVLQDMNLYEKIIE